MAISFVAQASAEAPSLSNPTVVARPTGVVAGDLLIALIYQHGNYSGGDTIPAGWTAGPSNTAVSTYKVFSYWKVAGSSEPSTYTWQIGTSGSMGYVTILAYRGAASGLNAGAATASASAPAAAPSVTTTTAGCVLACLWGAASSGSLTTPGGMTSRATTTRSLVADEPRPTAGASGTRTANGSNIGHAAVSVAIAPANTAPNAPTLTSPATGSTVDLSGAATFKAIYNDPDAGDSISAYYFRRKLSGAASYEYWNGTLGAWQSTEIKNAAAGVSVGQEWTHTFPSGAWANGNTYQWSVAFEDALGVKGSYASDATVTGQAPATVTVTAPTGTVTTTSRPTVTFSRSHPTGVAQARFRVRVFTAAQYGAGGFTPAGSAAAAESGWITSETLRTWTPGADLTNGTTYRAYVQSESAAGVASAWAYAGFTMSLTPPAAPTVTVTPDPNVPGVLVTVTGGHNPATFPDVTYRVERSADGGVTWTPVRGGQALVPNGTLAAATIDREAPPDTPCLWRAFADAEV